MSKGQPNSPSAQDGSGEPNRRIALPVLRNIFASLEEIQGRRFGYAFNGAKRDWCQPPSDKGILLPADPTRPDAEKRAFSGCAKYAACKLIPDTLRWKPWEKMTAGEKRQLHEIRCYRATALGPGWDVGLLESRKRAGPDGEWVGNPFGIRTGAMKKIADEQRTSKEDDGEHRDLSPCAVGGCVTPEMMQTYFHGSGRDESKRENIWAEAKCCPFYFRYHDSELANPARNPLRFVQCYIMQPNFIRILRELKILVAAPIFRSVRLARVPQESIWYPFYSALSLVQIPARAPLANERNDDLLDPTLPLRWQLTALTRQRGNRVSGEVPILKLFQGVENGDLISPWESESRLVSISEGQATAFLLQWVLIRRLLGLPKAALSGKVDLTSRIRWCYAAPETSAAATFEKLRAVGYRIEEAVDHHFQCATMGAGIWRDSTLDEDFRLLGLLDVKGNPTDRVKFCVAWLRARQKEVQRKAPSPLAEEVMKWLGPAAELVNDGRLDQKKNSLRFLCWMLVLGAAADGQGQSTIVGSIKDLSGDQAMSHRLATFEKLRLRPICRLIPEMHIVVRAHWTAPLRWVFVPTAQDASIRRDAGKKPQASVYSAQIIMTEDHLQTCAYDCDLRPANDQVLMRIRTALPLLTSLMEIEEHHVRDELIASNLWWNSFQEMAKDLNHTMQQLRRQLSYSANPAVEKPRGLEPLLGVLDILSASFSMMPEPSTERIVEATPVLIDLKRAVSRAISSYSAFETGKAKILLAQPTQEANVRINPMAGRYTGEVVEQMQLRAEAHVTVWLLGLVLNREWVQRVEIGCIVREHPTRGREVCLELVMPNAPFEESLVFDSDNDLQLESTFPAGRGFYTSFALARSLGATRQEVCNDGPAGIIRVTFEAALS